jgi:hypothetical protein
MGYVMCVSSCFCCKQLFSYNPNLVTSFRNPNTDVKEPICLDCINTANPKRIAKGLPPIIPLEGAYEACTEEEVRS